MENVTMTVGEGSATEETVEQAKQPAPEEKATLDVEQQINHYLEKAKKSDSGKLVFDKDTTEEVRKLTRAEKRVRDNQSALGKMREQNLALEATNRELLARVQKSSSELSKEQKEELEELKYSDPDAYYLKRKGYEDEAQKALQEQLTEITTSKAKEMKTKAREMALAEFLDENEGFEINDDVIEMDLPPRISNKIKNPEYDLKTALTEAKNFLEAGKVVANTSVEAQPNLGDLGGGSEPSVAQTKKDDEPWGSVIL